MTSTILLLCGQALLAAAGLHLFVRRVLPRVGTMTHGRIVSDVWGPLVLVGPMIAIAARIGDSVRGTGWIPLGAPVATGAAIVGIALVVGVLERSRTARVPGESTFGLGAAACSAGAGALLLLLAAGNELTVWTGQCVFAIAAGILWINTPAHAAPRDGQQAATDHAAGVALLGAIVCAAGQGVVAYFVPDNALAISAGLMVAGALVGGVGTVVVAGAERAARLGGWAAVFGPLFGIGVLSICHLAPNAIRIIADGSAPAPRTVARGFGAYGFEAVVLLALPVAALAVGRVGAGIRTAIGLVLFAAAVAIVGIRVAGL